MKLSEIPAKEQAVMNLALVYEQIYGKNCVYLRYVAMQQAYYFMEHWRGNDNILNTWCKVSKATITSMACKGLLVSCMMQNKINTVKANSNQPICGEQFIGYHVCTEKVEFDTYNMRVRIDICSLTDLQREVIRMARRFEQLQGAGTVFIMYNETMKCYNFVIHKIGEFAYTVIHENIHSGTVRELVELGLLVHCDRKHRIIDANCKNVDYFGLRVCTECVQ